MARTKPGAARTKKKTKKAPATRTKKAARTRSKPADPAPRRGPVPRLPRRQLTLPAGYLAESGGVATLRDVLSPQVATKDGQALSDEERTRLTLLRIEAQPTFELLGPGGVIDKARALDEVRRGTPLGRILVAVEARTIEFVRETADVQRRRRQQQYRERARARKATGRAPSKHR